MIRPSVILCWSCHYFQSSILAAKLQVPLQLSLRTILHCQCHSSSDRGQMDRGECPDSPVTCARSRRLLLLQVHRGSNHCSHCCSMQSGLSLKHHGHAHGNAHHFERPYCFSITRSGCIRISDSQNYKLSTEHCNHVLGLFLVITRLGSLFNNISQWQA